MMMTMKKTATTTTSSAEAIAIATATATATRGGGAGGGLSNIRLGGEAAMAAASYRNCNPNSGARDGGGASADSRDGYGHEEAEGESVVVAVNASKEMSRHALDWSLANIPLRPGDHLTLVALLQAPSQGRMRLWGLPRLAGDCANRSSKGGNRKKDMEEEMKDLYIFTLQQIQSLCDSKQVKVSVRVVSGACKGAAAMEAQKVGATWVVLDSQLKKEEAKCCVDQLQCNLVIVKRHDAKILRLNLMRSSEINSRNVETIPHPKCTQPSMNILQETRPPPDSSAHSISEEPNSSSSPEVRTPFTITDKGTSSATSSDRGTSPALCTEAAVKTYTNPQGDFGPLAIETDTDSEYEPSKDEECSDEESCINVRIPVSKTTNASPDLFFTKRTYDNIPPPHMWPDFGIANAHKEGLYMMDPWMQMAKTRPNSGHATPKVFAQHQGRLSTPTSPLGSSKKRLSGSSRLSFSMRESLATEAAMRLNPSSNRQLASKLSTNSMKMLFDKDPKNSWSKRMLATDELLEKLSKWNPEQRSETEEGDYFMKLKGVDLERTSSVRRAVSLSKHTPPGPPPLCSICQHKGPVFGKPPRRYTYAELELATGGFSTANFLAEGGFGRVHRGVLPDGQAVAVKQHRLASSQGDIEFCSEVEVLSCAQHRNLVMLIGYCIEDKRRLLVYEFVCNGSLDTHLYGREKGCLEWAARQKIAVGAARGLRYLHEECRVGCIVHRDLRPNNILLTHDFEPMVGDFGLARWQPDGDLGVQTRVIGTFGYLAPEYAQSGQITEKADVYSFGVVLLELVTGRKAVDLTRPKGQQCLSEWARPLLEENATDQLIDPLLNGNYSDHEVYCMSHAASLCIRKDPHHRPRMSQVLRMLEGDVVIDRSGSSTPFYGSRKVGYDNNSSSNSIYGSRSSRMFNEYAVNRATGAAYSQWREDLNHPSLAMESLTVGTNGNKSVSNMSYEALKAAYKDRSNTRRLSYEDII